MYINHMENKYNEDNQSSGYNGDNQAVQITEKSPVNITLILLFIVFALVCIGVAFLYMSSNIHSPMTQFPADGSSEQSNTTDGDLTNRESARADNFNARIAEGGNILRQMGAAEAAIYFNRMLESASNPQERGQIELNLGNARLQSNRVEAVALLKAVAINESYFDFTRAKATNFVLNEYTASNDEAFAREHIFTGPVWENFLGDDLQESTLTGFFYSADLSPTPEANMRIASDLAAQIAFTNLTLNERDRNAAAAQDYLRFGNQLITELIQDGGVVYGGTPPDEIALAMNRRGLALDILYFSGYIDDADEVKDSYREAISYLIDNPIEISDGTGSFIRYNYADFLFRLDAEAEANNIRTVLSPIGGLISRSNFTTFVDGKLNNTVPDSRPLNMIGHPETLRQIIGLSDEFRRYLLVTGVRNVPAQSE